MNAQQVQADEAAIHSSEAGRITPRLSTLLRIVGAMGDLHRVQVQAQVREELAGRDDTGGPDRAAAVRLAQECGKAVAHCCLAFMELQAGEWKWADN